MLMGGVKEYAMSIAHVNSVTPAAYVGAATQKLIATLARLCRNLNTHIRSTPAGVPRID